MAHKKTCKPQEHLVEDRCCNLCPKGQHVVTACEDSKQTVCGACKYNEYTEDWNFLFNCLKCRPCLSSNNMRTVRECAPELNRQCECMPGFYCKDRSCEHCTPVTQCHPGYGVMEIATTKNDTVCGQCLPGTFSHLKDLSPCINHTSCDKLGRELKTSGTEISDAVCGIPIPRCHWILPAGLWAGLVVTLILMILFCIIYWRAKKHSYMAAISSACDKTMEEVVPIFTTEPPHPGPESSKHCQESNDGQKGHQTVFYHPDLQFSTGNSVMVNPSHKHCDIESDGPSSTPMTISDHYGKSINHKNGYSTTPSLGIQSEPQEDEWRGT